MVMERKDSELEKGIFGKFKSPLDSLVGKSN